MSVVTPMPRVPKDTLAIRLLVLRHELGWSQREASERTGVPYGVWQGMEAGRETRNLGDHIAAISKETGYRRDWLMWGGPFAAGPQDGPETPPAEGGRPTQTYVNELRARQLVAA